MSRATDTASSSGEPEAPAERPAPKRLRATDVIDAQQEVIAALTSPRQTKEDRARFVLKRSTASGSLGVMAIEVDVPVCDEYPTAKDALAAAMEFTDTLCARYPMPNGNVRAK